jgi:hypothetical protein
MSSPKRVLVPPLPADTDVKYDSSGRVYKDMDALIERELIRIRLRIEARKKANGAAKAVAASASGDTHKS